MNLQNIPTKNLVSLYNHLSGKAITKFSDRATGEKQVSKLIAEAGEMKLKDCLNKAGINEQGEVNVATKKEEVAPSKVSRAAKAPAKKEAKAAKVVKEPADRSAAIAASWEDKKVAAARAARHAVKVAGETYKSVKAAFEALKLPLSKHIKFRGELKTEGRKTFVDDKGNKHNFILVTE